MKKILTAFVGCFITVSFANLGQAATLYWGTNSTAGAGVAGTWTTVTTSQRWSTSSSGPFTGTWTNSLGSTNTARFVSPAGTVAGNVAITVNKIQTDLAGYSFSGPTAITFTGTDAGIEANHTSGTTTIAGIFAGTGGIVKSGAGRVELNNNSATIVKLKITGGFTSMAAPGRMGAAPGSLTADWLDFDGGGFAHATATGFDLGANRGVTIRAGGAFFGASAAGNQTIIGAPIVGTAGGGLTVGGGAGTPLYSPYASGCNLILQNTGNSWNGPTTVALGTLTLGAAGVIPNGSLVTISGGTLNLNGFNETIGNLTLSSGTISGSGTLTGSAYNFTSGTLSSLLGGTAAVNKNAAGTVTVTLANALPSGSALNVTLGTLSLSANQSVAAFTLDGGTLSGAGTLTASSYTLTSGTLSSPLGNFPMSITKNSAGTLTINVAGALSGAQTVSSGALAVNVAQSVGTVTVNGGTLSGAGPLTGTSYVFESGTSSAVLAGTGVSATKTTGGTITISGANTFDGGFTLSAGVLSLAANNALGIGTLILQGGTIQPSAATARSATNVVTLDGDITFTGGAAVTLSGPTTLTGDRTLTATGNTNTLSGIIGETGGPRNLTINGTGRIILGNAANTYSGTTTVTNGTLGLDGDGSIGNGAGAVMINNGTLVSTADRTTVVVTNSISIVGTNAAITTASAATAANFRFAGNITAAAGTTLTLRNDGADGAADRLNVNFSAGGINFTQPIIIDNGPVGLARLEFFNSDIAADQTFNGEISGNGSISRTVTSGGTGGNTLLTASNSFTGGISLNSGNIGIGHDRALSTGTVTASGGGLFASGAARTVTNDVTYTGDLVTRGTLNLDLAGNQTLGGSGRTLVISNSGLTKISGTIASTVSAGSTALTKAGSGILEISSTNSYAGDTAVTFGNLRVSNISGSALGTGNVIVSAGATLSGAGSFTGNVTNSGTIAPGASPGTLSTGSEEWAGGGSYIWEINDTAGTEGADPGWDKIAITGSLNITATPSSKFTVDITSLTGASPGDAASFNNAVEQHWTILTTTTGITGFDVAAINLVTNNFSNAQSNGVFSIALTNSGSDLIVKFAHPPVITNQPVNLVKTVNESATFSVGAESALTYQWRKNLSDISGATDSSYTIGSVVTADAGSFDVLVSNASGTRTSSAATLTVNKADQTITFGALGGKTYGDADFGVSATASSGLPVSFSIFSGPATIVSGTNVHLTGAGTVVVRSAQAGNADYNAAPNVDQSFSVAKANLLVSANNTNVYGSVPVLTPSYSGFIGADNAGNSLTGSPNLSTTATTNSPVAGSPYVITVTLGDLASDNYNLTAADGTLTVIPATLTVTADDTNRVYGASNPAFTVSYSGFVNNEDTNVLSGSPALTNAADAFSTVAGSPYAIIVTNGTLVATNYTLSFVDGDLTVTKLGLTVTAENTNRVYGASNPAFTATYSGFANGETETVISGAPSFSTSANTNSSVGDSPYSITPAIGTLTAANYDFTSFINGDLTVTKAPLSVSASLTKIYGATNPTTGASYSGFVNNETSAVLNGAPSLVSAATTNSTVAGSPYVVTVTVGTLVEENYAFSFSDGTLTVTPATLTVTAEDTNRIYGASNPTFTASYSGFVNNEDTNVLSGSPSLTTLADTNSTVSGSPYTITAAAGSLSADNYTFSFVNGALTITKLGLTVTAENKSRAYGAAEPVFTAVYSGFVNGDTATVIGGAPNFSTSANTNSSVGDSPYSITPAIGTLTATNYDFTSFVNGDLTVTQAVLTVTADNKSKTYGATNPTLTVSYSGFVNNEDESVLTGAPVLSTAATTNSTVAGSPYTISISAGTLVEDNYSYSFVSGALSVTATTLTVTANDTNRVYGATNPIFTASYSGFVNGEDETALTGNPDLSTTADTNSTVAGSPYTITAAAGTLAADNYVFAFTNGLLTVNPAALTVTADNTNRVYGALNPAFTASYSGFANGENSSVISGAPNFSTSATTNSSVGDSPYSITPAIGTLTAANYSFTSFVNGDLTVTQAPLTVTANLTKIYGATNPTLVPLYIGFVNDEDESVLSGSPNLSTTADTNSTVVGSPYVVTVTTNTLLADNYEITATDGTLAVTPAPLTIASDDTNRVYGAANPTFTGSITGLQNADDITATYSTTATPTSPVGTYDISQTLIDPNGRLSNYTVTTNNGTLTVTEASLTVTSDNTNRVYGAANPAFTGSIVGLENSDNITATYSVTATTNSFVGNYVISQTLSDPDGKLGNYTVTTNNGLLSVTVATLTVTANSTNRGTGQTNPIFTGSIVGIQNNDNITANYTSTADTNSPAGLYDIVPELQDPDGKLVNYSVTTNNGVLTVVGAPVILTQPSNLLVGAGSNAVFTVSASGSSLNYQWRKDGTNLADGGNLSGATTSSLTLSTVAVSDSATGYSVFIDNLGGSITSSVVSLTVINPPAISVGPASVTNIAGTTATFNVTATGGEPLSYQWRFEGVDLPDEVFSSLSVLGVQASNAGNYTVVITNAVNAVTSAPAVLSVHYTLTTTAGFGGTVSQAPDEASYAPGSLVDLTATPEVGFVFTGWSGDASGTSNPLSVTMDTNKNITANFMGPGGAIIIDNDDAAGRAEFEGLWFTLSFINPHYGVDYRYTSPGTNTVTARATYRPEIVRPGNYDVYLFYPQRPVVRTTNAQWVVSYNGGSVSLGLDQHTNGGRWFQIAADKSFIAGTNQFVRVSNNTGETETNAWVIADAVRFVYSAVQGTAPTFITHPQSQLVNQSSNVTFTVQASGTGTLAYQWRFNNEPIVGATTTSYTRTNVQPADVGNYAVVVIHDSGSAISSNAVLSINVPPSITAQPANKTITAGQSATFSVTATGTAPLTYQWRFNSNNISGATSSSYSISNAFTTNAGYYSVVVSNVAAVATSLNALLTVNPDIIKPTISFIYPTVGGKVTNAAITMTGAAKDAIGVVAVKYVYAGATNTASGTTNWSANLSLTPGTNVVVAWSVDLSGNEAVKKTNTFYYNLTNFLVLNIIGNGQVSGLTNGQPLLVGRPYSATANPGANYVFTNWTGTVTSTNKTLSFIMQTNMVVNANFISNPFSPVSGKYHGLFSELSGVRHESAGFFNITLSSNASYTGKLLMDGNTLPISGKFDLSGQTSRTVLRTKFGKSALSLTLQLDWSTTNETIQGTVSDGIWTSEMVGDRATFDVNFNPTTNFFGRYTALIPPPTNGPIDAPAGYGYMLVTNSPAGTVTISQGALADGTVLSQKVPMSKFGKWPLYVPAYKAITRYTNGLIVTTNLNELRGSLIGWITFTNDPTRTLTGAVNWMKSELSPTNAYYAGGFTNEAELIASAYTAPASGTRLVNLINTTVVLNDGNLILPSTNSIFIKTNNAVTITATADQLKFSFDAKVGLLKGTFAHPDNTNKITSFSGAVLQMQNYGAGAFRGTNQSGSVFLGN